jgi:hypothetical protein
MTDESKITDEHRAMIGQTIEGEPVSVKEDDARRLRQLLGEQDPRWSEGSDTAPPYILAVIESNSPMARMPRVLPGGLLTNQEWTFGRPLKIGEKLKPVSQVVDIRDRMGGRYGYSVLVMMGTDFYDESGEKVASTMRTITQFDQSGAKS